ncbi:hypothetical protein SEPCBS119000_006615 [Sporothrix epigloea]|uniref:Retrotransposon gag domain-containing protein n=1 Tax=Sporothrix epigloea TaxID=1892477 RepID=A0ABP0E4A6_9PEZI
MTSNGLRHRGTSLPSPSSTPSSPSETSFDKIMTGAESVHISPLPVEAPEWAAELHKLAAKTIGDLVELVVATQGKVRAVDDKHYNTLRTCYEQITEKMKRLSSSHITIITDDEKFRQEMLQSCRRFARNLWAEVACVSENLGRRRMAVRELMSIMAGHSHPQTPPRSDECDVAEESLETFSKTLSAQQAALQIASPSERRPAAFDGKKTDRFSMWWKSVNAYFDALGDIFPNDRAKILWVGTLLTDCALEWHQDLVSGMDIYHVPSDWQSYASLIRKRFYDPAEPSKNLRKLTALRYEGDIHDYFARLQELNTSVELSGVALRETIKSALPKRILFLSLRYNRGIDPDTDHEFIANLCEAGRLYEAEEPATSEEESTPPEPLGWPFDTTPGPLEERFTGSKQSPLWPNPAAALKGVDQEDINRFKAANACIRYGTDKDTFEFLEDDEFMQRN